MRECGEPAGGTGVLLSGDDQVIEAFTRGDCACMAEELVRRFEVEMAFVGDECADPWCHVMVYYKGTDRFLDVTGYPEKPWIVTEDCVYLDYPFVPWTPAWR